MFDHNNDSAFDEKLRVKFIVNSIYYFIDN